MEKDILNKNQDIFDYSLSKSIEDYFNDNISQNNIDTLNLNSSFINDLMNNNLGTGIGYQINDIYGQADLAFEKLNKYRMECPYFRYIYYKNSDDSFYEELPIGVKLETLLSNLPKENGHLIAMSIYKQLLSAQTYLDKENINLMCSITCCLVQKDCTIEVSPGKYLKTFGFVPIYNNFIPTFVPIDKQFANLLKFYNPDLYDKFTSITDDTNLYTNRPSMLLKQKGVVMANILPFENSNILTKKDLYRLIIDSYFSRIYELESYAKGNISTERYMIIYIIIRKYADMINKISADNGIELSSPEKEKINRILLAKLKEDVKIDGEKFKLFLTKIMEYDNKNTSSDNTTIDFLIRKITYLRQANNFTKIYNGLNNTNFLLSNNDSLYEKEITDKFRNGIYKSDLASTIFASDPYLLL